MPNTIKNSTLLAGNQKNVIYFTLICVGGAQETATVVYDSSAIASTIGITDPLTSTLVRIKYSSNSAAGVVRLDWDATTKVAAWALPYQGNEGEYEFDCFGGLKNQGGSGRTGDIVITTTGLVAGDVVSLVLEVRPN